MLKISVKEDERNVSFNLEGRLAGPWVSELEQCWQRQREEAGEKPLSVRLCAVSFIDDEGKELLSRMVASGASLEGNGCLVRAIIAKIVGAFRGSTAS